MSRGVLNSPASPRLSHLSSLPLSMLPFRSVLVLPQSQYGYHGSGHHVLASLHQEGRKGEDGTEV